MEARPRYAVIVNPKAGGGRAGKLLPRAEGAFASRGLAARAIITESLEHAASAARLAADAAEVPVVMSGDGMIGHVGGALAGSGAVLGIIPGGRGNDLARVLGIPRGIEGAVDVIAVGAIREIDVGEVNGRRFLGIASCGFDSEANRFANEAKIARGNLVYLYAALRALAAWKPARFELSLDGVPRAFTGFSVAAANSKAYGGGMYAAPAAELDDGLLEVVWCEDVPKLRVLSTLLPRVFKGTHVDLREVTVERAREVEIAADRPFAVYADGDRLCDLPARVRLLRRALRVIAPAGALNPT
jgi:YegS/Rv2252/BmrU family lipid kinase